MTRAPTRGLLIFCERPNFELVMNSPVTSTRNRPRKHGEHRSSATVRARILETAFRVISSHGYSGMTMAKVATMSGLPIGSVYWHFESKDLLLNAMIEESFAQWHETTAKRNRPQPGETFEEHVTRIFSGTDQPRYFAADFWRLGVILSVEKSVPEQTARTQFLRIRELQKEELARWWQQVLPSELLSATPSLPHTLSAFTLAMQDGNAIAGASGEALDDFQNTLRTCLIHLVQQAQLKLHAPVTSPTTSKPRRPRAAATRKAAPATEQ